MTTWFFTTSPFGGRFVIDEQQYITIQHQLVTLASLVREMQLSGFIETAARAETIGPILDPTLYREAQDRLRDVKALANALLPFQEEINRQFIEATS